MPEQNDKVTFRDKMRVFFRWRNLFLLSAAALAIGLLVAAHFVPVKFTAVTKFQSRVDSATPIRGMDNVSVLETHEQLRQTLRQRLTGRQAVAYVAVELGLLDGSIEQTPEGPVVTLTDSPQRQQSVIGTIQGGLDVRWDSQSKEVDLVSLTFTSGDATRSYEIPNALVAYYTENVGSEISLQLTKSHAFLVERAEHYGDLVKEWTEKKIDLETRYVGLMEDTQMDIVRRQQQAKADRDAVARLLHIATQKVARLEAMRDAVDSGGEMDDPSQVIWAPNPELERLGQELREYKTELDLAMTLQNMTREHPAIQTLLTRIAIMEERIRNTPERIIVQEVYGTGGAAETWVAELAAAQSEVEILTAELDRVESQILGYEKMMSGYESARGEYAVILSELAELVAKTTMWDSRRRQVDMALEAEDAKLRMQVQQVEPAERPILPSFPALNQVLAVTFLGALAFGGLMVFFFNSKDRTIATGEQAAKVFEGVPVVGTIGQISTAGSRSRSFLCNWILSPILLALIVVIVAVLTLSITLKLRHPDEFKAFREAPVSYVLDGDNASKTAEPVQ